MSLIFQALGLSYRYPNQPKGLFEGLELTLYSGDHVALMGVNGSGKTTLLELLAGILPLQTGQLTAHAEPLYLRQEDALRGTRTVLDAVLESYPDLGPVRAELLQQEAAHVPDPLRYAELLSKFADSGGYTLEAALHAEFSALGYAPNLLERPLSELSGGERRLLRLVSAFARPQALYLLDEPTNYLDERATNFLTRKIRETAAACLIVSHDRRFLDETVNGVLELERGSLRRYRGNYSSFRTQKETEYEEKVRKSDQLKRDIAGLKEQERTYKVWGARKEKEKSGAADRGFIGARAARLMRRGIQAKERLQTRISDLEDTKPWIEKRYAAFFETPELPSGVCLSAHDIPVLGRTVSLNVAYGERWAVAGVNGAGKTTLLRTLLGLAATTGTCIWDKGAIIGYLPQRYNSAHDAESVETRFTKADQHRARTLLGALGVSGEVFTQPLTSLSEGQKRKVRLVQLILARPNVLFLDEPTTHLDYVSVEMLEAALLDFPGTLLLVSHDAYLLARTTERRLEL